MKCFLLLMVIAVFSGCSRGGKISGKPEKILSLSAAATKILYDLGVPPAAIDEHGKISAGEPSPEIIGKSSAVSREKIAEIGIDHAIVWNYQKDASDHFKRLGIPVTEIAPFRLKDYPELVRRLGTLTGKEKRAEELCSAFQKQLSARQKPETMRRVYFELYGPFKSVGEESYTGDLLACAGGIVMNRKTGLVSAENLMAHQPEIIFYTEGYGTAEDFRKRPGFLQFPAVKNNRIYAVPRRLITEGAAPLEAIEFFRTRIIQEK